MARRQRAMPSGAGGAMLGKLKQLGAGVMGKKLGGTSPGSQAGGFGKMGGGMASAFKATRLKKGLGGKAGGY